ncbi:MAG: hypothetical protein JWP18_1462 [Solirubrobacterales bacterium]|nr:hypothetical protein [Solirubrobacterales bacterium]
MTPLARLVEEEGPHSLLIVRHGRTAFNVQDRLTTAHAPPPRVDARLAEPAVGARFEGRTFTELRSGHLDGVPVCESAEVACEVLKEIAATPGRHLVATHGASSRMSAWTHRRTRAAPCRCTAPQPQPSARHATQSISTSAPTASPVVPTHVRLGRRSGNQGAYAALKAA